MKVTFIFLLMYLLCITAFPAEVIKNIFWGQGPLVIDNEGSMYLGYDSYSISKYSPKGELLLKIGRKGEGPGDFKRISRYAFNPIDKHLYVTEYYNGNRRVSKFATDGKFSGVWDFQLDWSKYSVVSSIDFDSDGNVLLIAQKRTPRRYKGFILTNEVFDLIKFSPDGKMLKKIYSFNSDFDAEKPGNFQVTIPFQNAVSWIVYRNDIIVKEISGSYIQIFSPDGELKKRILFPIKSEKVTKSDLDSWEKRIKSTPFIKKLISMGRADVDYWRKNLPFPSHKPNSSWAMHTDSKGNLYIRKYTGYNNQTSLWFIINIQTGKTTSFKLRQGEELSRIWHDYFFIYRLIETDDDEIETITKYREEELLNRKPE